MILGEVAVNELFVKGNAFALQGLEHKMVNRPEIIFKKGIGAKAILVAHHDKLKI